MFLIGTVKKYVTGIIIGLAAGLWIGVNIGKEQPLYSNPFNTESITSKAKQKADDILKDAKSSLREKLKDEADDRIK